jgi:hypothetical protein
MPFQVRRSLTLCSLLNQTTTSAIVSINMANIYMNSSSNIYGIPDQSQMDFWLNNAHLSEEQRQAAWSNGTLNPNYGFDAPPQSSMVPRTMPNSMSNSTQLPVWTSSLVVALPMF